MTTTEADPRKDVWVRYPNDALSIPELTAAVLTRCSSRKCQAMVWRGVTRAKGVPTVFDVKPNGELTGTNHWRTCRDRERFRKR
jgi:hypothetical protein